MSVLRFTPALGIPYRSDGRTTRVAWDILGDCPECGTPAGERCTMRVPGGTRKRATPCRARCAAYANATSAPVSVGGPGEEAASK